MDQQRLITQLVLSVYISVIRRMIQLTVHTVNYVYVYKKKQFKKNFAIYVCSSKRKTVNEFT